jgi:hypothetical protein
MLHLLKTPARYPHWVSIKNVSECSFSILINIFAYILKLLSKLFVKFTADADLSNLRCDFTDSVQVKNNFEFQVVVLTCILQIDNWYER